MKRKRVMETGKAKGADKGEKGLWCMERSEGAGKVLMQRRKGVQYGEEGREKVKVQGRRWR
jgi:hypothetical protein